MEDITVAPSPVNQSGGGVYIDIGLIQFLMDFCESPELSVALDEQGAVRTVQEQAGISFYRP